MSVCLEGFMGQSDASVIRWAYGDIDKGGIWHFWAMGMAACLELLRLLNWREWLENVF